LNKGRSHPAAAAAANLWEQQPGVPIVQQLRLCAQAYVHPMSSAWTAFPPMTGTLCSPLPFNQVLQILTLTPAPAVLLYVPHCAALFLRVQAWHLRHMVTPVKRMLPARLGIFKRAIYALATGWRPSAATAATAADAAAAASAAPMAFVETPVRDVVADIEARSRAPLGLPALPQIPQPDKQQQHKGSAPAAPKQLKPKAQRRGKGLTEQRAEKGLAPGQWDPSVLGAVQDKRSIELLERKSYLRNFWYCAGEWGSCCCHTCSEDGRANEGHAIAAALRSICRGVHTSFGTALVSGAAVVAIPAVRMCVPMKGVQ
jgi:hypothetical protein